MRKILLSLLLLIASGVYYLIQACPSFYFWDSAELTAAVLTNGVPHPPGFPLLLLLGRIWNLVTTFDRAEGLNFLSAGFASIALVIWYLVIGRIMQTLFKRDRRDRTPVEILSFISAALLGFSFTYAIQATRFEVYSLNFLLTGAAVYLALRIIEYRKLPMVLFSALVIVMGLSLGAHILTAILVFPGIFLLLYLEGDRRILPLVIGCAGSLVLAAILYFTLYLAARSHPPLNWGDPSTPAQFLNYIFVREFSVTSASFGLEHLLKTLSFASGLVTSQFGAVGILLAAAGLIYLIYKRAAVGISLLLIALLNALSIVFTKDFFYENLDLHGYNMVFLALAALFMAISLHLIYQLIKKNIGRKNNGRETIALLLTLTLAVLAFFIPVRDNFMAADLSDIDGRYYAGLFLDNVPSDAVVLSSYYNTYFCLMAYLADSQDDRGISLQCIYNWDHRWGRDQAAELFGNDLQIGSDRQNFYRNLINRLMKNRPIYIEYDQSSRPLINYLYPDGLLYRFSSADTLVFQAISVREDVSHYRAIASQHRQIEWIRSWIYWFSNRGQFYSNLGKSEFADEYISAMNDIAAGSEIR